jgi:hypothetical protein
MGRNWKRAQPHGPAPRQFLTRQLFFRLMKQMLRITHFIGRSENAVRLQIRAALIVFVLLRIPGGSIASACRHCASQNSPAVGPAQANRPHRQTARRQIFQTAAPPRSGQMEFAYA